MSYEKLTNVFLCVTEYHILLSLLISTESYNSDDYENIIILCNGGRFKDPSIYNLMTIGNIQYRYLKKEDFISYDFVERIGKECTNTLFLFNLSYPHFIYLAYLLYRNNKLTALVQDGLGLYMYQPYTLREKLSHRKWSFQFLRDIGIKDKVFFSKCFGWYGRFGRIFQEYNIIANSSFISNIWLSAPDQAQYAKFKVKSIPVFTNISIEREHVFFKFEKRKVINFKKNDILFVDQRIDGTSEFIQMLSNRFPLATVFVKLHPRSPISWADGFKELPNVTIIDSMNGIPLELLIQTLSRIIIISAYSAALLIDNPNCTFYYIYPWYAKRGYGKGELKENSIFNPTKHIKVIASVEEINLY